MSLTLVEYNNYEIHQSHRLCPLMHALIMHMGTLVEKEKNPVSAGISAHACM